MRLRCGAWALTPVLTLFLVGCAVGPDYQEPELGVPTAYESPVDVLPVADTARPWWLGFEDPDLDALVALGLDENVPLREAEARARRALEVTRSVRSDLFPVVDGDVTGNARSDLQGDGTDSVDAGLVMAFVPDLFGAQRRRLQAALADSAGARLRLADARRLTVAGIAQQYIELRRTQARLILLEQSLVLQQQTLEIVRLRRFAGLAADLGVQRASADLARNRAQRGLLEAARARAENALAVLTGQAPASFAVEARETAAVPDYRAGPAVGLPADLLRNRPDVRAAEQDLIAATATVGVEIADLYPRLRLPGSIAFNLTGGGEDVVGALTAGLALPALDAGGRRADVRAARADVDAALARYRQSLLVSFQEVENALVAIRSFSDRNRELEAAVVASERAFEQLNALYREGLATFIDILDAQRQLIGSREQLVDSTAGLASAVVRLYVAAGAPVPADPVQPAAGIPGAKAPAAVR